MAIKNILSKIDILRVKSPRGLSYAQELVNAANLLRDCIQYYINHETVGGMLSTADIADVKVDGKKLSVALTVQDEIYPSYWGKKRANVFWLLNDGFTVKRKEFFHPPFQSHWISRKGAKNWIHAKSHPEPYVEMHFVEKGIRDFNRQNELGVHIEVKRPLLYYGF